MTHPRAQQQGSIPIRSPHNVGETHVCHEPLRMPLKGNCISLNTNKLRITSNVSGVSVRKNHFPL